MKNLRTHGKSTIVWILMGLLLLGLGGFGVTNFSGGTTGVGSVGDTKITANDYARALRSEINAYAQQTGQPLSMAQAQAIGLPQAVQARLFTAAALEEQTSKLGISVGDARVAASIAEAPAFQGPNGKFDRTAYAEILRREGLSESEFEGQVRVDEARMILQNAVAGGVVAPAPMVDEMSGWLLEQRDFSWHELTEAQLPAEISDPDEETLEAWHTANADRFTAPEARKISYVWLTPEMLADDIELDEAALRATYEQHLDEYQQPERRMVSRLVFPDMADAEAAKARLDAGEVPFASLVIERGLTLDDIDLGEVSKAALGTAGDAVFALEQPGVVGPVQTDLGPALFSMNAILDPVDIPFEQAREELRNEAALDRATRQIDDRMNEYEDLLAGGATLEDVAKETPMELGQIDWSAGMTPPEGSIAGYQAFRDLAETVEAQDFPQIERLDDGGIFALRLDEVVPPTLKPFEEVRDEVAADWRAQEVHRQLLAMADEERVKATASETEAPAEAPAADPAAAAAGATGVPATDGVDTEPAREPALHVVTWRPETGMTRDGWVDGVPPELVAQAFEIAEPGEIDIVDADDRVFIVRLDGIHGADLGGEDAIRVLDAVRQRLGQSLQSDVFEYYARAAQMNSGLQFNQQAINAINAQVQ